jgi:hypothetical protein
LEAFYRLCIFKCDYYQIQYKNNPCYSLKKGKNELGLGFDFLHGIANTSLGKHYDYMLSLAPYLRQYFFEKEWIFIELYHHTGYYFSTGVSPYCENTFIWFLGPGAGIRMRKINTKIFSFGRMGEKISFVYIWRINLINSLNPREIRLLNNIDGKFALIYNF